MIRNNLKKKGISEILYEKTYHNSYWLANDAGGVSNSNTVTYTAEKDCYVCVSFQRYASSGVTSWAQTRKIDGVAVTSGTVEEYEETAITVNYSNCAARCYSFNLKAGQTLTVVQSRSYGNGTGFDCLDVIVYA